MSRSRKDGRRGGGHKNTQGTEVWSRRCQKVNMWNASSEHRSGPSYKTITHRLERRAARRATARDRDDL